MIMDSIKTKIAAVMLGVSVFGLMAGVALGAVTNTNTGIPEVANPIPGISSPLANNTVGGLMGIVKSIVTWIYTLFFILAVLFILFAAFTYLTAGGDETKVAKAKNQLIYAAVAIAVALLAVGFSTIIQNFFNSPTA